MSFLIPFAFALSLLLPIIFAMYLLKLRRTEQIISSTYLWKRMVQDLEANAPWQRLQHNLLLLLQLLFLLALIFALARPFSWAEGSNAQTTILIFDISASMAATDLGVNRPNRLEVAKDQARLLISNLPKDAQCAIISAGMNTQVLVSASRDRRLLYQTLDNLLVQPGGSDLTGALELASALAAHQPDAEIVIYSDGQVKLPERLALQGQVRYMPVGENGNNQAISLVTLEPGNSDNSLIAFVQVSNYAAESSERRLTLSVDGALVDVHDLEIPAYGTKSIISEIMPADTEVLEVELMEDDLLALDDQAWAIQRTSESHSITLISSGNLFLETALGLLPGIDLNILTPEVWEATEFEVAPASIQTSQLSVFDSYIPTSTIPGGNLLFIWPMADTPYFSINGSLENPQLQPVSAAEHLLKYVDLSTVRVLDAIQIHLPEWGRPLIVDKTSGAPMLFAGQMEERRIAVLAFDPRRSDLPLQVSYPILMANLAQWLLPGQIGEIPSQIQPGETVSFTPPPEIKSLTITRPDGSRFEIEPQDGRAIFADTGQLGVYRVAWGDRQSLTFAVNLFSPQESDILPIKSLPLFDDKSEIKSSITQQARREWWRPLTAVALVILLIEWLVYNRATLTKLRHIVFNRIMSH